LLAVLLTLCADVALGPYLLSHRDLGWHLAAGDWMRFHHALPYADPWSFTAGNTRWFNMSWAWDLLASLLYKLHGLGALLLAALAVSAAVAALQMRLALREGAQPAIACLVVALANIALPVYAPPDIFFSVSPQIVTLIMCLLFYGLCASGKKLWALPLLMLLWCNLHGGFPAGFVILGAFGLQRLAQKDYPAFRALLLTGIACVLATLCTPYGFGVYAGVLRTVGNPIQQHVTEWQPYLRMLRFPGSAFCLLYMLLFAAGEMRLVRKTSFAPRLLGWIWLIAGLLQMRYIALFLLLSAPSLTARLSRPREAVSPVPVAALAAPILALLVALPLLWHARFPQGPRFPDGIYPVQATRWLADHGRDKRILNHWNYGGYILFATQGVVPVFIDGRAANAYPDTVLNDYDRLLDTRDWQTILTKYRIDMVLWPDALPEPYFAAHGWHVAFHGPVATVYARPAP
jgi:hypothetical protein